MTKRLPYKSLAVCPQCDTPLRIRCTKQKHIDALSHLVTHYTICPKCGTRCRTETHTVIIKTRGTTTLTAPP